MCEVKCEREREGEHVLIQLQFVMRILPIIECNLLGNAPEQIGLLANLLFGLRLRLREAIEWFDGQFQGALTLLTNLTSPRAACGLPLATCHLPAPNTLILPSALAI